MMVEFDVQRRGIRNKAVLDSLKNVPRHLFVSPTQQIDAYNDYPLPIGYGQTISQPFIVALMAEAAQIKKTDKVLEVGTDSGYGAAVLSNLAKNVYTVESIPELAKQAKHRLASLGYSNVKAKEGDGSVGWPEEGPYDAILVTASAPEVPNYLKLQLNDFGRLVLPVEKALVRVTRIPGGGFSQEFLTGVRFVPLIGKGGYQTAPEPE